MRLSPTLWRGKRQSADFSARACELQRISLLRRSGNTLARRDTHPVIASVAVRGVGRDDVAHPSEQTSGADPQPRRDDQPQDVSQDAAIVELPYSGDDRTQNCCQSGITHRYYSPPYTATIHLPSSLIRAILRN